VVALLPGLNLQSQSSPSGLRVPGLDAAQQHSRQPGLAHTAESAASGEKRRAHNCMHELSCVRQGGGGGDSSAGADAKHVSRFTVLFPRWAAAGRDTRWRVEYIDCWIQPRILLFSPLWNFSSHPSRFPLHLVPRSGMSLRQQYRHGNWSLRNEDVP